MSEPIEVDLNVLKRAMIGVIENYIPSIEKFNSVSDNPDKELAQFVVGELSPQLQDIVEKALNPNIDFDTFMRLNNFKVIIDKE